ncbi:MAG TPA: serine hydrolase domain-containing protein [Terracidiphilus sp.]|nr:serine hydrolase domain-containing protein [Terracidiphilus sp.]
MKIHWQTAVARVALGGVVTGFSFGVATAQIVPRPAGARTALSMSEVKPESVGISSERLERLHALMQDMVDKKQEAGIVTLLARHGKIVDFRTYGQSKIEAGAPMTRDAIFRDFSMTKPVTGAAMMILYEQGKWLPSDPVSKFIPEFTHLKVFKEIGADGNMVLEDPAHPPTMAELMTHTAGFTYGIFGNTPVDKMMGEKKVWAAHDLHEFVERLSTIPLLYQPGTRWVYSVSMDIEGYIIEQISGQSLPDFMRDHIFDPLGMKDAGFYVPQAKRGRFAQLYVTGADGRLVADATGGGLSGDFSAQPTMPLGGGGMVSTTEDYYRFLEMLLHHGELDGKRILAPSSVALMTSNHLRADLLADKFGIGAMTLRPGFGYGYTCAVAFDPLQANMSEGKGSFSWGGAAGTWFWADPTNDLVFIGMVQRMMGPASPNIESVSRSLVYQALIDPAK